MVQKQKSTAFKGKVEIIGKSPYAGSGPRGIDVYTRQLSEYLSRDLPHESLIVSREVTSNLPVNLVHYTFFDPFFLTLWGKIPRSAPFIVTVHDLIPLRFPEHFPSGVRGNPAGVGIHERLARPAVVHSGGWVRLLPPTRGGAAR